MCGINGLIYTTGYREDVIEKHLAFMNQEIIHRGPDEDGFFIDHHPKFSIGMAMRRLSIIDLSTGKQPIFSTDNQKIIVFNGEIYNYRVLRSQLLNDGFVFTTNSDTEVILKLYEKYGEKAFSMLDGMFALSIFDRSINKLFIARDFFGEKPLYYMKTDDSFYWASELKSMIRVLPNKPSINNHGLNLFFQLTYIPAPFTIYQNIFKLEANHYLEIDCDRFDIVKREIKQNFESLGGLTKDSAIKINHDIVFESVKSRSISDVSLGTFLSGGVDSSIITLCLARQIDARIDTFSIGFEKKSFDESDKSRIVAKLINSKHHEFIVSERDFSRNIDQILLNFDEPFADSSALATYLVANKTKDYVKVALTGDGGDEVYGGYNKYYMGNLNNKYTRIVHKNLHYSLQKYFKRLLVMKDDQRGWKFKVNRLLESINYEGDFYYNIISLGFTEDEAKKLITSDFQAENVLQYFKEIVGPGNSKTLNDFRQIDKILSLEGDMLVKVDRTSMLSSLECRAPFLNKAIWNFTNQLPEKFLIKGWDKKHILKESFKQYFPDNFLNKSKRGFGVPVGDWLRGELKDELISYTNEAFILEQGIFDFDVISNIVYNHLNEKADNTFRVWTFYCFQKWYKNCYL